MAATIHHIVTGELESSLPVSLLNSGAHPSVTREQALPYGFDERLQRPDGTITQGVMVPVPVWLILGAEKTILIDAGLGDTTEVSTMQSRYGVDFVARRTPEQEIVAGLAAHGVTPDDIDLVVLTHLHFDHIGNNELFRRARFVTQRDELPQSVVPPLFCMFYYPEYAYKITSVMDRLTLIDGDAQVDSSVRLVKVGGHTPGCMVVMVETSLGTVCLTSDVMYNYRNLELNWPMGSFWNLPELMRGYDRVRAEANIVVPEHDWEFLKYFPRGIIG